MRSGVAEILVAGKQVRAKMNHKTKQNIKTQNISIMCSQ